MLEKKRTQEDTSMNLVDYPQDVKFKKEDIEINIKLNTSDIKFNNKIK